MELDLDIEGWPEGTWAELAGRAIQAAGEVAPELANTRLGASVLFTTDVRIQDLNRDWRAKDKPTNVLSFPMLAREKLLALPADGPPEMLGDIALAYDTCLREAEQKSISLEDHAAHLLIHGMLHLAGHDHEISTEAAETMEALEVKALAIMGIGNPYEGSHS